LQSIPTEAEWGIFERSGVFLLAATSIACLLSEFYGFCPMRLFTLAIFAPALLILTIWSALDFQKERHLAPAVLLGAVAGILAAISYDLFRLPFVFSRAWGLDHVVPPLNLFRVFPAFGAMILGQAYPQPAYSLSAQLLGWAYHFSNGLTFGIMYMALIRRPTTRNWPWAIVMAVGFEIGMLATPYTKAFGIPLTSTFVWVTLSAHLIFGVVLGLACQRMWPRFAALRRHVLS
jgi:hypothetical protein